MIRINCDIGERGADHPTDRELMGLIHIANIACGGHAGDAESVGAFRRLAEDHGAAVSAHLSYPDTEGFGRRSLDIPGPRLLEALDEQYRLMPDVATVKFHGALYNDSCRDVELADLLADWLQRTVCTAVITAGVSALAEALRKRSIAVVPEAFAERRYTLDPLTGRLALVSRAMENAVIRDCGEAVEQVRRIAECGLVRAVVAPEGRAPRYERVPLSAETICIHSDSPIALELARKLAEIFA